MLENLKILLSRTESRAKRFLNSSSVVQKKKNKKQWTKENIVAVIKQIFWFLCWYFTRRAIILFLNWQINIQRWRWKIQPAKQYLTQWAHFFELQLSTSNISRETVPTVIQNSSRLVIIFQIIIADATKKEFNFSFAILQGNLPALLKINSFQRIFEAILRSWSNLKSFS